MTIISSVLFWFLGIPIIVLCLLFLIIFEKRPPPSQFKAEESEGGESLKKPLHESSHCNPLQLLQTIIPINTTGTLLSAKPLAPSFSGLLSGELQFTFQSHQEDIRSLAPFLSVYRRPLSLFSVGSGEKLSHGKMCTLLPTVCPNGCL